MQPTIPPIGLPPASAAFTRGVRVTTQSLFVPERSHPENGQYFFTYHIRIANEGRETVQLLSRRWIIADAAGHEDVVEGDGVIGEQPVLEPGDAFEYDSFCPLTTPMGTMHGAYTMITPDGARFQAKIAPFALVAPMVVN